jgi:uncharacterized protein with von Willebrand factor type A (vWA) domain
MTAGPVATSAGADRMAVAFARVLRGAGLHVPTSTVLRFAEALGLLGLDHRGDVYWAGRATLIRRPEDVAVYDRAFRVFWDDVAAPARIAEEPEPLMITLAVDDGGDDTGPEQAAPSDEKTIELRFSATEVLRQKDFADYDDDELAEAHRLMGRLRFVGSPRRSLRLERASRRTPRPDIRRTVRAALRTEGEPMRRHFRAPATRFRRLVLLLDVSGSMEPYARALLRFVQAAVAGRRRVEAFALGTRLTRLTRELGSRDPDRALRQAAHRVLDWSGGTRLGDGLRQFNDEWGVRGMARGAVVVILSDGWDRGDPEALGREMQRLGRVAHRIIWVNPLKVTPGYAPLARGMSAALPYVDRFVEGHSLAALDRLAEILDEA